MLEDHNMDKKNRLNQPLNKGNGSDSKKLQDASSSKQLPRHSKRREPAGSIPKNDNSRGKPPPQKFKTFDKRPKPRGGFVCGKEGPKINLYEDEPELGSLYSPGSKKQNLNHLLNFQYTSPHGSSGGRSYSNHGRESRSFLTTHQLLATSKHKYNKEQFLQANCQFVVRQDQDYNVHMADPDQLVNWDFIEQIRGFGNEDIKCPICLDIPKATQMTRCGHCFCWPCILHYLALSDKSWRKCPICYESVHLKDLKSFVSIIKIPYSVNEEITFQLMTRERGSTLLYPVSQSEFQTPASLLNLAETQLDTMYSKLLTASNSDIMDIVLREEAELCVLLDDLTHEQCPTLCFTERALELLRERKARLLERINRKDHSKEGDKLQETQNTTNINHDSEYNDSDQAIAAQDTLATTHELDGFDTEEHLGGSSPIQIPCSEDSGGAAASSLTSGSVGSDIMPITDDNRRRYESMSSEDGGLHQNTFITADDLDIDAQHGTAYSGQPHKQFYFYQSIDGQQIFLHAVNVRMLEMTYGSLENCPHTIKGRILEKESGSMTEELRKRLRYLQHLPVTCQFEVAEIELKRPLINKATEERFKDQIESRARRRMKRAREEKRRSKRIEEVENKQYGHPTSSSSAYPRHLRLESHLQFPECGSEARWTSRIPIDLSTDSSRANSPSDRRSESPTANALKALSLEEPTSHSTSFAQKLREGKTQTQDTTLWPGLGERRRTTSTDSDNMVPNFRQSFGLALASSIDRFNSGSDMTDHNAMSTNASGSSANNNKKKKKKQKLLLFTNGGMPCG